MLLLASVVLLQVARRVSLPYPAMLAAAGVALAFVPGTPTIRIDPQTALALFIAPVLLDAAYDFPIASARLLWRPLVVLAGGAVLTTAAIAAWIGGMLAGLPVAAALVLGAIVAPPDAAAAVAVLGSVSLPRRTVGVLRGESLFNDAVALLLFSGASPMTGSTQARLDDYRLLGLEVVEAQRKAPIDMRDEQRIDMDACYVLQEEIDWRELTLLPDDERRIAEI